MHAEYIVFYDCCNRQIVEKVCKKLPYSGRAVFSLAFGIETIHLSDLSCFMVPSQ